jgi:DNA-binding NarL/FixJ family response regulator
MAWYGRGQENGDGRFQAAVRPSFRRTDGRFGIEKSPSAAHKVTFAIVDHRRSLAQMIAVALEATLGLTCAAKCASVEEAETNLVEAKPRLVILDWRLGDVCGGDLIRRYASKLPRTRWLLFTATPTATVLKEAAAAGIHGAVSKTADYAELIHAIERLLAGGLYYCSACMLALTKAWQGVDLRLQLTQTECAVLSHISRGLEAKAIAAELNLSIKTVHNTIASIRAKSGTGSMVEMAKFAEREGIT